LNDDLRYRYPPAVKAHRFLEWSDLRHHIVASGWLIAARTSLRANRQHIVVSIPQFNFT
jgi:hypothetical protein